LCATTAPKFRRMASASLAEVTFCESSSSENSTVVDASPCAAGPGQVPSARICQPFAFSLLNLRVKDPKRLNRLNAPMLCSIATRIPGWLAECREMSDRDR
jgi:hypothetical protein